MRSTPNERSKTELPVRAIGLSALCLAVAILGVQAACPPQNNCEQCQPNGTCITCRINYGYQPSTGYCESCGLNCSECSPVGGNCTRCNVGFGPAFTSRNGSCGRCVSANCDYGCSTYGAGKCDRCNNGYGPNPTFTLCLPCVEHCQVCVTNTSYCDTCDFGYSLFDPGNKTCGACSRYCTMNGCFNRGPGACDKCDPGYEYFRNTFTCGECAANCSSCAVNGASQCDNCTFGYGLTPTNTCAPCASNCSMYGCAVSGAGKCDRCDPGFALIPATNTCAPCSPNCNISTGCTSPNTCINCNLGYGQLPNGSCGVCSDNCTTYGCAINGAGKCDRCDLGFELTSINTCSPITTTRLPTTTPIPATTSAWATTKTVSGSAGGVTPNGVTGVRDSTNTAVVNTGNGGMVTAVSSKEVSGMTTKSSGSNGSGSGSSASGVPPNTASPTAPIFSQPNGIDWRVLLTLLMLIFGGILITIFVCCCWMVRFYPLVWYRRRIYMLKEC